MAKIIFVLGLLTSAAMLAIGVLGTSGAGSVAAHEMSPGVSMTGCHIEELALDEGYGISRKITRHICSSAE